MVFLYVFLQCFICIGYNTSKRGDIMEVLALFKTHNTITIPENIPPPFDPFSFLTFAILKIFNV